MIGGAKEDHVIVSHCTPGDRSFGFELPSQLPVFRIEAVHKFVNRPKIDRVFIKDRRRRDLMAGCIPPNLFGSLRMDAVHDLIRRANVQEVIQQQR